MTSGNEPDGEGGATLANLGTHVEQLRALLASADGGPPDPDRIVRFAGRAVAGSDHCALTLARGGRPPATVASTGDVPRLVDALQYRLGEGPCLSAIGSHGVTRADDLATATQWPAFAPACVEATPVRSMFSVRLVLSGENRAAMNFYAERPHAFDDADTGTGAIFGPFAALALQCSLYESEVANLTQALGSSRQIGTAIGIIMTRELITSEEAFARLVGASQRLNRKLRDVAAEVAETGTLPAPRPAPRAERAAQRTGRSRRAGGRAGPPRGGSGTERAPQGPSGASPATAATGDA
jgi:hypothetical protein